MKPRDGVEAKLTHTIIGRAIEVHRHLGPGLLERVYESALCHELTLGSIRYVRQVTVPLVYKGCQISEHKLDLVVEGVVLVEIKSVARLDPVHIAQALTYLRVAHLKVGLLLNFNSAHMRDGIKRLVAPGL